MKQLKDAMIKAGLLPNVKEERKVIEEEEKKIKKDTPELEKKKFDAHQIRTKCEYCGNYSYDIEFYEHRNKLVLKKWLCMKCADEYKIDDTVRRTAQSQYAREGRFSRRHGRTVHVKPETSHDK